MLVGLARFIVRNRRGVIAVAALFVPVGLWGQLNARTNMSFLSKLDGVSN